MAQQEEPPRKRQKAEIKLARRGMRQEEWHAHATAQREYVGRRVEKAFVSEDGERDAGGRINRAAPSKVRVAWSGRGPARLVEISATIVRRRTPRDLWREAAPSPRANPRPHRGVPRGYSEGGSTETPRSSERRRRGGPAERSRRRRGLWMVSRRLEPFGGEVVGYDMALGWFRVLYDDSDEPGGHQTASVPSR